MFWGRGSKTRSRLARLPYKRFTIMLLIWHSCICGRRKSGFWKMRSRIRVLERGTMSCRVGIFLEFQLFSVPVCPSDSGLLTGREAAFFKKASIVFDEEELWDNTFLRFETLLLKKGDFQTNMVFLTHIHTHLGFSSAGQHERCCPT